MPELIWLYLTALLYYRTSGSCVALAEALQTVSHDRLTRRLPGDWSGHTRLERAFHTRFVWERGSLIIDDTVGPKPFATAMEGLAWVSSSQAHKPLDGFSLVLLVWTDGIVRIPVGIRRWQKGGPSKSTLALERLSYARHRLHCHPDDVLFDAWYPARALLKRVRDYGWSFVCRLKKNRRFNGQAVRHHRRHPYWAERGWLSGGLNVLVVRHGQKVLRHQPPRVGGCGGPSIVSPPLADPGSDPCVQGSARPHRRSGPLRAGAAPSCRVLPARLLHPGAGAA